MTAVIFAVLLVLSVDVSGAPKNLRKKTSPVAARKYSGVKAQQKIRSRSLASKSLNTLAKHDPNAAVEVRGQSRTLSMMLVLKKERNTIDFIRVRKDYRAEINQTHF